MQLWRVWAGSRDDRRRHTFDELAKLEDRRVQAEGAEQKAMNLLSRSIRDLERLAKEWTNGQPGRGGS